MPLTQELLSIGLSQKESEIYLSALQLGYCSVQEIAQKAGINRTTAYTHIKNLISRGLMKAVERNAKIYYVAEKPDKLQYIYEQQEKEIKRRREMLDKIMPELESIYNLAKEKPTVRYYAADDPQGRATVRQEIANVRAVEIFNIFNYDRFKSYLNKEHVQNLLDSVDKAFNVIYIAKNKEVDPKIRPFLDNEKFHLRFLPEAKFNLLCEILIADEHVYISRSGDHLTIKDALFAQTLGLLFHALWGVAERI